MSSLTDIEKRLAALSQNSTPSLIAIVCRDPFVKEVIISRVREGLARFPGCRQLSQVRKTFGEIGDDIEAFTGPSFFDQEKRLLVLEQEETAKKESQSLLDSFGNSPNSPWIICVVSPIPIKGPFALEFQVPDFKPWEREAKSAEWIEDYFACSGSKIAKKAALVLARSFAQTPTLLLSEIEKIRTYCGQKECTIDDIARISILGEERSIWQLYESLCNNNSAFALQALSQLIDSGTHPLLLLRQIRSQVKQSLEIGSLLATDSRQAVSQRFPQLSEKMVDKAIKLATARPYRFYSGLLLKVDKVEEEMKSSQDKEERLLERLIINCAITS